MILGYEANIGLIYYGPKWSWAEMVMGRNGHGPKRLWAEMTRNRMTDGQAQKQLFLCMQIGTMRVWRGVPKITNGIKHDFPFSLLLTLHKVPRGVLKTEGEARGFQLSQSSL